MQRTAYFIILVVAGAILYDIVEAANGVPGDTISEVVWRAVANKPFIPFLIGFLCGHLFWQRSY